MIITKREACEIVLENFKHDNGLDEVNDSHCLQSSKLAVAMEYLGLIQSESIKAYTQARSGNFFSGFTSSRGYVIFSFREFLDLLP